MAGRQASPATVAPIADEHLRGLASAFDRTAVHARVAARLLPGFTAESAVRPVYVRYKPETSCIVAYEAELRETGADAPFTARLHAKYHTPGDFERAAAKLGTHRWAEARGLESAWAEADLGAVFYAFPNDREMPGLRLLGDRKRLRRFLVGALDGFDPDVWRLSDSRLQAEVVRSKPERRAVVRLQSKAVHRETGEKHKVMLWLRAYAAAEARTVADRTAALHGAFRAGRIPRVPRLLGFDTEASFVLLESLPGTALAAGLDTPHAVEHAARAARELVRLQAAPCDGLRDRSTSDLLDDARTAALAIRHIAPALGERADAVLAALVRKAPSATDRAAFVHGDFYADQILVDGRDMAFLDFDRAYRGDPLADAGNFLAHLHIARIEGTAADVAALGAAFTEAYATASGESAGAGRIRFYTAHGLFLAAIRPFRTLQPGWNAAIESALAACEEMIA